ncbi:Endoglucanase-4 [Dactylella cylindrospora]|nr:Endoglucanase-4 [Dactylella cylindrospora]
MKFQVQALLAAGLAATAQAHAIFQKISINGAEQGQLVGFRAPTSNSPIMDVNSNDIICQVPGSTSSSVVNVPAGAKLGTYWGHVIGGEQYPGDVDNPIAASHKGPIAIYLAKVDNAATTSSTGLKWFKVAHEGFNTATKKWAVDTMIDAKGWWYFTLPSCLAPGNYLLRAELIALHSAYDTLGAQFYISCVQINITGGGSYNGGSTVLFPGAYPQDDPGIKISIYGSTGQPDNNGRVYAIPGPAPMSCSGQTAGGGSSPTTTTTRAAATTTARPTTTTLKTVTTTTPKPVTTTAAPKPVTTTTAPKPVTTTAAPKPVTTTKTTGCPVSSSSPPQALQTLYGQCGGVLYKGPTVCAQGTCKYQNDYYSQCLN